MAVRRTFSRLLVATLIVFTAFVSVGLTAPSDGLFSISIRTVLIRLAIEIDVKFGSTHFHTRWSALPDQAAF